VRDGGTAFGACLASLRACDPAPAEIIVVDDGSQDGSDQLARALGVQVIRVDSAQGPAAARNRGARLARGDLLFFVDADVTVPPQALRTLRQVFAAEPTLAAVIGSYDDAPAATNFLSQYKNLLHHYVHQQSHSEAGTFWGACGAIRRSVFAAMGGFDGVRYPRPSIEDIELGYRLKKAGHRIRLVKELQVKHHKRWTTRTLLKSDFFDRALPWTELILRDKVFVADLNLTWRSRLSVGCAWFVVLATIGLPLVPSLLWPGLAAAGGLIVLNRQLYQFFWRKRGAWFALRAVPWHWAYLVYSGLAFAIGCGRHLADRHPAGGSRRSPLASWS